MMHDGGESSAQGRGLGRTTVEKKGERTGGRKKIRCAGAARSRRELGV